MDEGYWEHCYVMWKSDTDGSPSASGETEDGAAMACDRAGGRGDWSAAADRTATTDWQRAEALSGQRRADRRLTIAGYNRGGLLADFGALQGFVPASHLLTPIPGQSPEQRAAALAARIGETLTVRVAEIDRDRCRLILSERLAARTARPKPCWPTCSRARSARARSPACARSARSLTGRLRRADPYF